jgi:beta-galactosidase
MHARTLPGLLSAALGIRIEEYEALSSDMEYPMVGSDSFPGTFAAIQYADWTSTTTAEPLVTLDVWHLAGYPALTRNAFGAGYGYYSAVNVKEEAYYDQLIADVLNKAYIPRMQPPPGVEFSTRQGDGRELLFIINHCEVAQTVSVPAGKLELITNTWTHDTLVLEPYGVAVLKLR